MHRVRVQRGELPNPALPELSGKTFWRRWYPCPDRNNRGWEREGVETAREEEQHEQIYGDTKGHSI